jgi:hypothetical protein
VQFISGAHRPWPAELVESGADDAAGGFEVTLDHELHRNCRGVPAARCQSAEDRVARGLVVEVKGLRVEFGGEAPNLVHVDSRHSRCEGQPRDEVLEIPDSHVSPCVARIMRVTCII